MTKTFETAPVSCMGTTVEFSRQILGTGYICSRIPFKDSLEIVDTYFELGGRTIDTARNYGRPVSGDSVSEKFLGMWLKSRGIRNELKISTKGVHPRPETPELSRVSAENLRTDISESLETLGVDHVDIYWLHVDNPKVPVEEIMPVLDGFVKTGMTKLIGASNWRPARIQEANKFAVENGLTPFAASQFNWSYARVNNKIMSYSTNEVCMDDELYSFYKEKQIPIWAYCSQAHGLFSQVLSNPVDRPYENLKERSYPLLTDQNKLRIEKVRRLVRETGASAASVVQAYLLCNDIPAFVLLGCSKKEQVLDSLSDRDLKLDKKTIAWMDDDSRPADSEI